MKARTSISRGILIAREWHISERHAQAQKYLGHSVELLIYFVDLFLDVFAHYSRPSLWMPCGDLCSYRVDLCLTV
jgi:hypothetical protein